MQRDLPIIFERDLYRAVIRYKQEHPGALEARSKVRNRGKDESNGNQQEAPAWMGAGRS